MTRFTTIGRWLVIAAIVVFIAGTIGVTYLVWPRHTGKSFPDSLDSWVRVQYLVSFGCATVTASGVLGIGGLLLQAVGSVVDADDETEPTSHAPSSA